MGLRRVASQTCVSEGEVTISGGWGTSEGPTHAATEDVLASRFDILCCNAGLTPVRTPLPLSDKKPQPPPGAMDGRLELGKAHAAGCTDLRRSGKPKGPNGPPSNNFDQHRRNRHSALRGVRFCHARPLATAGGLGRGGVFCNA